MKKVYFASMVLVFFISCSHNPSVPDVSNIKVDLKKERFDEDFFTLDTNRINPSMEVLSKKYGAFLPTYISSVLGVNDEKGILSFYRLYKPVYDSSQLIFKDIDDVHSEIKKLFQYTKYYFPNYQLPAVLLPVVGPMNSTEDLAQMQNGSYTPCFLGPGFLGISLQFYLGKNFSLYQQEYFTSNVAPPYRSRRFDKKYIVADVSSLIVDDLYPDVSRTKSLVEQMIEKGKRWWLRDKFLPLTADSVRTGYTQQQLDWCHENEGLMWSYITKNENLYSLDPSTIQTYIGEAPFTQVFSQQYSPGNIGAWIGRQIMLKYEAKNPALSIDEMMKKNFKSILEESNYKPK